MSCPTATERHFFGRRCDIGAMPDDGQVMEYETPHGCMTVSHKLFFLQSLVQKIRSGHLVGLSNHPQQQQAAGHDDKDDRG